MEEPSLFPRTCIWESRCAPAVGETRLLSDGRTQCLKQKEENTPDPGTHTKSAASPGGRGERRHGLTHDTLLYPLDRIALWTSFRRSLNSGGANLCCCPRCKTKPQSDPLQWQNVKNLYPLYDYRSTFAIKKQRCSLS